MTLDAWTIVRFLHILGAIMWIGGQVTIGLVVTPVLRVVEAGSDRVEFARTAITRRFARVLSWAGVPLLLATGFALSYRAYDLGKGTIPDYGFWLGFKIILFLAAIILATFHWMVASREVNRWTRLSADIGMVLSLGILLIAVTLGGG